MAYEPLEKLFYKDSSSDRFSAHKKALQRRFNDESTFRTGIELEHGELFLGVPRELSLLSEQIFQQERRVETLWHKLPRVARRSYIWSLVVNEVVASNEIEGVHSTRKQIELALEQAKKALACKTSNAIEDVGHTPFGEFARLYLALADNPSLPNSLEEVRAIYDGVVDGTLSSEDKIDGSLFRASSVVIENERGKIVHCGVMPESAIREMMGKWLAIMHSPDIPCLYAASICHFLFGYIHPFYDGNGRTARYLLALQLSQVISIQTVLSLSRTIFENKRAYYKAFDTVERPLNASEATEFAVMLLSLLVKAQEELIFELEQKSFQIERLESRVESYIETHPALQSDALYFIGQMWLFSSSHEVRLGEILEHLGVSKPTTRTALKTLEGEGLIERTKGRPLTYRLSEKGVSLLEIGE